MNLALKWKLTNLEICRFKNGVFWQLKTLFSNEKRVKGCGLAEMLVRRRLAVLLGLVNENGVSTSVVHVSSGVNKAVESTRVPRKWLKDLDCLYSRCGGQSV